MRNWDVVTVVQISKLFQNVKWDKHTHTHTQYADLMYLLFSS